MGITLNWFTEDPAPTGNVCVKVCAGVVMPGQLFTPLNLECTTTVSTAMSAQWESNVSFIFDTPLTPTDNASPTPAACAGTSCNKGDFFAVLHRIVPGGCTGSSSNNVEFDMGELIFQ